MKPPQPTKPCPRCDGTGRIIHVVHSPHAEPRHAATRCRLCNGYGRIGDPAAGGKKGA